ncbi:FKBP-type peptidyl-prolyl cis-trans isomerase [Glaciihabitans sp. dw_435]|uniref:FKBP-type peptidyl-prolyl cis-trans isomerase n=1 Tax=Glaciihabitans sp. dw_435 TaxID=2720081 RepID=UPI001BD3FA68|nr:FKBP-type peptidyl-prolyl cis-trans isomerase [Glaciihabitans sp. dw_435]
MRKSVALIVAAGIVAVLAGCSSPAEQAAANCDPLTTAGTASAQVEASGKLLASPTVSFPTPLTTSRHETSVLVKGKGTLLTAGTTADIQASVYDSKTGTLLTATKYDLTAPLRVVVGNKNDAIGASLQCQTVGSRIASTVTVEDIAGPQGVDPSFKLGLKDTLILVTDIQAGYLAKADGAVQPLKSGFPSVVTAPDGTPGLSFLDTPAPTKLMTEVLKRGDGATVKEGDQVVIRYTGVLWETKAVFDDTSWARVDGALPAPAAVVAKGTTDGSGLLPGFAKALIGSTVGSQIVVIVPPDKNVTNPTTIPAGDTPVYVFDVLGIQK